MLPSVSLPSLAPTSTIYQVLFYVPVTIPGTLHLLYTTYETDIIFSIVRMKKLTYRKVMKPIQDATVSSRALIWTQIYIHVYTHVHTDRWTIYIYITMENLTKCKQTVTFWQLQNKILVIYYIYFVKYITYILFL